MKDNVLLLLLLVKGKMVRSSNVVAYFPMRIFIGPTAFAASSSKLDENVDYLHCLIMVCSLFIYLDNRPIKHLLSEVMNTSNFYFLFFIFAAICR